MAPRKNYLQSSCAWQQTGRLPRSAIVLFIRAKISAEWWLLVIKPTTFFVACAWSLMSRKSDAEYCEYFRFYCLFFVVFQQVRHRQACSFALCVLVEMTRFSGILLLFFLRSVDANRCWLLWQRLECWTLFCSTANPRHISATATSSTKAKLF